MKTEANERIKLEGDLSIDPLLVKGRVDLKSLPIRKYAPYYADSLLFDVENGILDLSSDYAYGGTDKDSGTRLSGLSASINSLRLKKRDETENFLTIPSIAARNTQLDHAKKKCSSGRSSRARASSS
jgi:hypothetical protein